MEIRPSGSHADTSIQTDGWAEGLDEYNRRFSRPCERP